MRLTPDERAALEQLRSWEGNVPKFFWDNFQVEVEPWVVQVCEAYAVPGKKRIALQASVGVGKSATEAMIGWHFLSMNADQRKHPGKYPNGYALGITKDTLKSGLWKEFGVWYERSPFLQREFTYTASQIVHKLHDGWWIRARGYAKNADPETQGISLSGLHSPWAIVLLEEIGEMHPAIGRRAEQILSDAECEVGCILGAGNPTSTTGLLHDVATRGAGWTIIRITGDPDDPNCSKRTDKNWAREQIKEFGRDNPWVMSHILGLFPPGGLNVLLTPDEVREAMQNRNPPKETWEWAQKRIGIDVARFGDDRTVLFPRQGLVAFRPAIMRGARTDAITARALNMISEWRSEAEFVDDSGHWGHGVVDGLLAARRSVRAVLFEAPAASPQYLNRRAEMWFRMADKIKSGLALPNMPEMIPELTKVQYGYQKGKMALMPKEIMKKDLGFSPDLADALALTFAEPDMPSTSSLEVISRTAARANDDYDPHREWRNLR